jgi:hypothetical protein
MATTDNQTYDNVGNPDAIIAPATLVSGTGTNCGTSTGALMGGTTAATGWNFAANGGIAFGNGRGALAQTDTNADNVCLLQSGSGQLSGVLSYVSL